MESVLNSFYACNMQVEEQMVKDNIKFIEQYVKMLRDRRSAIGRQYDEERELLRKYLHRMKSK